MRLIAASSVRPTDLASLVKRSSYKTYTVHCLADGQTDGQLVRGLDIQGSVLVAFIPTLITMLKRE